MRTTNRTVLDLSKVQYGSFWYVNQYGQTRHHKSPGYESVRNEIVSPVSLALYHPDYPGETTIERGKRLGLMDVWTPVVQFQLTANHNIQYTGKKALAMWKAWNERIFNKKKG